MQQLGDQEEDGKTISTKSSNSKRMRQNTLSESDNKYKKSWIKAAKGSGRWTLLENDYIMAAEERSENNARHTGNSQFRPAGYVNGVRLSDDEVANYHITHSQRKDKKSKLKQIGRQQQVRTPHPACRKVAGTSKCSRKEIIQNILMD